LQGIQNQLYLAYLEVSKGQDAKFFTVAEKADEGDAFFLHSSQYFYNSGKLDLR